MLESANNISVISECNGAPESRPLRHLFERRLNKHELQGCSSNWQSSGFQIRVLGVRISPPLPYSKASAVMLGLFCI